ncbi:MAG: hypothetical protein ACLUAR_19480 [Pilosibacter sp.]
MRKWKSCLLLAAGMAAALSTAAMASQGTAEQSDMVTVEVKECKGGAIDAAYDVYDENGRIQYTVTLPIGEKVQIPRGTELTIDAEFIDYGYETYETYVTCHILRIFILFKMEWTILKKPSMKEAAFGPSGRLMRTVRYMLTL